MSGSDIQTWSATEIPDVCRSPSLRNRYELWLKLSRKDAVPLLKDIYGNEEEARLDESMLLLQVGSDFIYVHQGRLSVQKYGKVFRGVLLSEIEGGMGSSFMNLYNTCIREGQPKYVQFKTEFSARHVRWERVALPVYSDVNRTTKFVMTYSEPLDDKLDILNATFDRSPIGMIAAARAVGENRSLDEAEILLVNARARSMLKIAPTNLALQTIASLRNWIKEVVGWDQVSEPSSATTGRTTILFKDRMTEKRVSVIVEPIDHFVIYHLIDMGV